jgi:AcrR family transcriptional regulator
MVYRRTQRVEARLAEGRERILHAARTLVVEGGFRNVQIASVAQVAGVATGSVYRHFPSRAELVGEVFREAAQHEVDVCAETASAPGTCRECLTRAVETFVYRAVKGRRLAWALIAELVDPAVETERLGFRRAYAEVFADLIARGVASGECPAQDASVSAACLVGALAEPLVVPLTPGDPTLEEHEATLTSAIIQSGLRMVFGDVAPLSAPPEPKEPSDG